jgi:hypothetical protein
MRTQFAGTSFDLRAILEKKIYSYLDMLLAGEFGPKIRTRPVLAMPVPGMSVNQRLLLHRKGE